MDQVKTTFEELLFLSEEIVNSSTQGLRAVLMIHSMNISSGNMECIGLQEDDPIVDGDGSQLLPENWHKSTGGVFSFKYRTKAAPKRVYVFKIILSQQSASINAVSDAEDSDLLSTTVKLSELQNPSKSIYDAYNTDILFKITPPPAKEAPKKSTLTPVMPVGNNSRQYAPMDLRQGQSYQDPLRDYGRSDLHPNFSNPNGNLANGNQIGPFHPLFNGNGRTQGARFDPFGPGGINGFPDDMSSDFTPPQPNLPFGGGQRRGPPGNPFGGGFNGGGFGGGFGGNFF